MMHEIINTIGFQTSLLLLVALGGYLISSLINQSAVIGQIIVGIIIGPSVLGLVTYTGFVSNLAYLGAVILLFVIGLEFKLNELVNIKTIFIAIMGVIIPWISGYFTASVFGFSTSQSIFIGTVLTATSIAITANVLHEFHLLKTSIAKTIIGAAVLDDILALFTLTLTTNVIETSISFNQIAFLLVKIVGFFVIALALGYFVFTKMIYKVDESRFAKKYPEFIFVLALSIAFLYGLIAELLGISAIIGAFISGVFLNGVTLKHSRSFVEGSDYFRIIFASMFFVSLGVLVNMRQIDVTTILFLVTLTIVAILSKIIGCGIPAKLSGFRWKEALTIGIGMSPRGEIAMIVGLIGLKRNIIGQPIYITIVMMSIITTVFVPIVFKWLLDLKNNGDQKMVI